MTTNSTFGHRFSLQATEGDLVPEPHIGIGRATPPRAKRATQSAERDSRAYPGPKGVPRDSNRQIERAGKSVSYGNHKGSRTHLRSKKLFIINGLWRGGGRAAGIQRSLRTCNVEPLFERLLDGALPSVKDEYETIKSRYFGIQTKFNFGGKEDIGAVRDEGLSCATGRHKPSRGRNPSTPCRDAGGWGHSQHQMLSHICAKLGLRLAPGEIRLMQFNAVEVRAVLAMGYAPPIRLRAVS